MASKDIQEVLEKVGKLVRLANDGDTEESRNAALSATQLMAKHELVLIPRSEIERVEAVMKDAQQLAKRVEGEGNQKLMIGAMLGLFLGKKGVF